MEIRNKYVREFHTLINNQEFNFEKVACSSIFQRRLLNYLKLTGYGYAFGKLIKVFIRKETGYLDVVKGMLEDVGILETSPLEENVIYTPKGNVPYVREELLNDIQDNINTNKKVFDISIYLKIIEETIKKRQKDIRICLMCEELMINTPVVTNVVLGYLKDMYKRGIYTKNSPYILRIIGLTNQYNTNSKELLVESLGRKYNLAFINRIIKAYSFSNPNDDIDTVINKVINNKFYFKEKFIPILHDFYKRHKDLRTLDIICEKATKLKIELKPYNINSNEVEELIKFYSDMQIYKEKKDIVIKLLNEYGELNLN